MTKKLFILLVLCSFLLATPLLAMSNNTNKAEDNTVVPAVTAVKEEIEKKVVVEKITEQLLKTETFKILKYNNIDVSDKNVEISFNENLQLVGKICNALRGQAVLKEDVLSAQIMSTKMMCPDETLNTMENSFAQVLTDGVKITVNGETYNFQNGDVVFVLQKQVKALNVTKKDLVGKEFVLAEINSVAYKGEKVLDLNFDEDLRVSGGICNRFTGQAEIKDNKLVLERVASTNMLCHEEALNKVEQILFTNKAIEYFGDFLIIKSNLGILKYSLKK